MKLVYINADLFESTSSLAHCVSQDLMMGKGIAKQFKRRFGRVEELKAQGRTVGGVSFLQERNRYLFYLITKERYFYKPTYDSLKSSLEELRDKCLLLGVKELAIPKIGCGLDRLEWYKVQPIIENVFRHTNMTIKVYVL